MKVYKLYLNAIKSVLKWVIFVFRILTEHKSWCIHSPGIYDAVWFLKGKSMFSLKVWEAHSHNIVFIMSCFYSVWCFLSGLAPTCTVLKLPNLKQPLYKSKSLFKHNLSNNIVKVIQNEVDTGTRRILWNMLCDALT